VSAAVLALLLGLTPAPRAGAQGTLSAIEADVDAISRQARPSLVTVIAQRTVLSKRRSGLPPERRPLSRVGSGVAIARSEILTTASVVLGAEKLVVITDNGLQVEARLHGMDPIHNVALLDVDGLVLPPLQFSRKLAQPGDWVIALGSSYGAAVTQSVGNISYRYREPHTSLLQLTNQVYPGNSGGAALNSRGELIGLVQGELGTPEGPGAGTEDTHRPAGMSFVLPAEDILPVYELLRRDGRPHLGFMGVSTKAGYIDSESSPGERIPLGAVVEATQAGGPAARVGLKKGDLIVAYDGERVEYPEQLARWVAATAPGTLVNLVWARDEMRHSGRVALNESPTPIPSWMQVGLAESTSTPASSTQAPKVADLQARIRQLNRELDRLRGQQGPSH
jgi:serine protease Do